MTNGTPHPKAPGPRRSRARTAVLLVPAAWAVLEIWLLSVVANAWGALAVMVLLGAGLIGGAVLVKRAGRRAWRALVDSAQRGETTPRGGSGAWPVMLGGLLLMVPGLLSDVAGLLCLFPPTRALLRRAAERSLEKRRRAAPGSLGEAFDRARGMNEQMRIHRPDGKVIPGEVVREEPGGPGNDRRSGDDPFRPPLTP